MSECIDPAVGKLLHAYELGVLTEEEEVTVEAHLLKCPSCYESFKDFKPEIALIRGDDDVLRAFESAADSGADVSKSKRSIWKLLWPDVPLLFRPALAMIAILLMLWPTYLGLWTTDESDRVRVRQLVATAHYLIVNGQPEAALKIAKTAAAESDSLSSESDDLRVDALECLGEIAYRNHELALSDSAFDQAIALASKTHGEDHPRLIHLLTESARTLETVHESDQAEALTIRALEIAKARFGSDSREVASALRGWSNLLWHQERMDEVIDTLRRAVGILEKLEDPVHDDLFAALFDLGVRYRALHRFADAEQYLLRALSVVESHASPGWMHESQVLNELGEVSLALCRYGEAGSYLRRALQLALDAPGDKQGSMPGVILNDLGKLLAVEGDFAEAEQAFKKAYDNRLAVNGLLSANLAEPLGNLGELYLQLRRYEEAEDCLKRALEARLQHPWHGPEHPYLFYSLEGLGRLYTRQERYDEADSMLTWALRNVERAYGPRHLHVARCHLTLGDLALVQNKPNIARGLYDKALSIDEEILGSESPCLQEHEMDLSGDIQLAAITCFFE